MKHRIFSKLTAVLSAAILAIGAFPFTVLPASAAAEGSVKLIDGTLVLSGAVTVEQIQAYKNNHEVTSVMAADDCVLPADCQKLFYVNILTVNSFTPESDWGRLTTVDLSAADASHVTSTFNMFGKCCALQSVNLSGMNFSSLTFMYCMFDHCINLQTVDLTDTKTPVAECMASVFSHCYALESITLPETFITKNATSIDSMFRNCTSIETIDLGVPDTSSVTGFTSMFYNCSSLKTIYARGDSVISTAKRTAPEGGWNDSNYPFTGCTSLTGGNGTAFTDSRKSITYFRFDKGGSPGYLTNSSKSLTEIAVKLMRTVFPLVNNEPVKIGNYIMIEDNGTKLQYNKDFTLTYQDNTIIGYRSASVTVKGIGKYKDSVKLDYTIKPDAPEAPKLQTGNGNIKVSWKRPPDDPEGVLVAYCQNSGFDPSDPTFHYVNFLWNTSVNLTTHPKPGETWYVRICSYITDNNGKKYGSWSEPVKITVK